MHDHTTDSRKIAKAQAAYARKIADDTPSCGTGSLQLTHEETGEVRVMPLTCKKWSCNYCATKKRLAALEKIKAGHPERHIVLTLKERPEIPTRAQVEFIRKAFTKLKTKIRRTFEEFQYLAVLELTKKGTPHFHILQRGTYIPYRWLKDAWSNFTGAWHVSISAVEKTSDAANELAKYLTKTAREMEKVAPGMTIITCSRDWRIDEPEESSEYSMENWQVLFVPHNFQNLGAALDTMLDAELVEDPDGPGHKIRGPDPPGLDEWTEMIEPLEGPPKKLAWSAYYILCAAKDYSPWREKQRKLEKWKAQKRREQKQRMRNNRPPREHQQNLGISA